MKKYTYILSILLLSALSSGAQEYKSLFWSISGNNLKDTSYLYGTMHVQDKRVFNFRDGVMAAFDSADILALELNMDSVNPLKIMMQMTMDSSITLEDLLPDKKYQVVKSYVEDSLQLPMIMLSRLQPMFVATFVEGKSMNQEMDDALDMYFFKRAKSANKTISGLEEAGEQISAFNSIPYRDQANDLYDLINNRDEDDGIETMSMDSVVKAYLAEDLEKLLEFTRSEYEADDESERFIQVFLTDRNIRMVSRMEPLLKKGSVFIGVGAAHLPMDIGIIELLRAKGYKVEPL